MGLFISPPNAGLNFYLVIGGDVARGGYTVKETLLLLLELQELENSLRGLRELKSNLEKIQTDNQQSIRGV